MNRKELIHALFQHAIHGDFTFKGERPLLEFLLHYFSSIKKDYHWNGILIYIPEHINKAAEILKTDNSKEVLQFRNAYLKESCSNEIPVITDVRDFSPHRQMFINNISEILEKVTDDKSLKDRLRFYFNSEESVLNQTFQAFLRKVFQYNLYKQFSKDRYKGKFGKTTLKSSYLNEMHFLTFKRKSKKRKDEIFFCLASHKNEETAYGIGDVTDFITAYKMIQEVTHKLSKRKPQKKSSKKKKGVFASFSQPLTGPQFRGQFYYLRTDLLRKMF